MHSRFPRAPRRFQHAMMAGFGQRRRDAGQVQEFRVQDVFPVEFIRGHFADGGVFAVVFHAGGQRRRGGLGEKQRGASGFPPDHPGNIHPPRAIFPCHAPTHGCVRQGGKPRALPTQPRQRRRHISLRAHRVNFQCRRVFQPPPVRRRQADAGFAEGGEIKLGGRGRHWSQRTVNGIPVFCFLFSERDGGGGGSRTPVRKSYANGNYTLSPAIGGI